MQPVILYEFVCKQETPSNKTGRTEEVRSFCQLEYTSKWIAIQNRESNPLQCGEHRETVKTVFKDEELCKEPEIFSRVSRSRLSYEF